MYVTVGWLQSRVRALAFSPDGAYGLSAAAGDRHVAVWDLVGAGRGGSAQAEAAALLAMEEPAVSISCSRGEQAGGVTIVALAQSGEAYVWQGQGVTGAAAAEPTRIRWERGRARRRARTLYSALPESPSLSVERHASVLLCSYASWPVDHGGGLSVESVRSCLGASASVL